MLSRLLGWPLPKASDCHCQARPGQARPGAGHRVAIEGNEAVAVAGVAVAVLLGFAVGQARGALFGAVAHGVEP